MTDLDRALDRMDKGACIDTAIPHKIQAMNASLTNCIVVIVVVVVVVVVVDVVVVVVVVVVFDDAWVVDVFGFVVAPVGVAVVFSERPECRKPNGFVEKMRMIEMRMDMNMETRMRLRRKMRDKVEVEDEEEDEDAFSPYDDVDEETP